MPAQARDALKSSLDDQKLAWAMLRDPNVPAEAKAAAGEGCQQGVDALIESATAMGCDIE